MLNKILNLSCKLKTKITIHACGIMHPQFHFRLCLYPWPIQWEKSHQTRYWIFFEGLNWCQLFLLSVCNFSNVWDLVDGPVPRSPTKMCYLLTRKYLLGNLMQLKVYYCIRQWKKISGCSSSHLLVKMLTWSIRMYDKTDCVFQDYCHFIVSELLGCSAIPLSILVVVIFYDRWILMITK